MQQIIIPGTISRQTSLDEFQGIKINDHVRIKSKYLDILAVSDLHPEIVKHLMAGKKIFQILRNMKTFLIMQKSILNILRT